MTDWVIEPLSKRHERKTFHCRVPGLNAYIERYASQDVRNRAAKVYAATAPESDFVAGYYSLSAADFEFSALPPSQTRRLPPYNQLPAVLLGRLAVDERSQGLGLGVRLLLSAFQNVLKTGRTAGVYALIVDAWDGVAADFYRRHDFHPFVDDDLRFFMPAKDIEKALAPGPGELH
ncbi:MAG: hypothetical protein ACYYKD_09185 [Rhodospirillales bacterium]